MTAAATEALATVFDAGPNKQPMLGAKDDDPFRVLSEALKGWDDREAAAIVKAQATAIAAFHTVQSVAVAQWIRAHRDDPKEERAASVVHCIETDPPEEVTILRLLSRAGSQKLVFLANWRTTQREIVLKRFIRPEAASQIIERELTAHVLSNRHPNIIETHLLKNASGEPFLLERRLQEVLRDEWDPHGSAEAANLLYDMAHALQYLEEQQLVHGDIKPDNIGFEDGRYILLDFGICRNIEAFDAAIAATGSLRTRAPELLSNSTTSHHTYASDVWALGATVYRSLAHHFPLIKSHEDIPRVSEPSRRTEFEALLVERSSPEEWAKWVTFDQIHEPLKTVLEWMLQHDPNNRWTAKAVVKYCDDNLAAVLRSDKGNARMSPADEIDQLYAHLPATSILELMPQNEKRSLRNRIDVLAKSKGLDAVQRQRVEELQNKAPKA